MSAFQISGRVTAGPAHGHYGFYTLTLPIPFFGPKGKAHCTKQR